MLSCLPEKKVMMAILLKFLLSKPWLPEAGLVSCVWPCLWWMSGGSLAYAKMGSAVGVCAIWDCLPRSIWLWVWYVYSPWALWWLSSPITFLPVKFLLVHHSLKSFDFPLVKIKFVKTNANVHMEIVWQFLECMILKWFRMYLLIYQNIAEMQHKL